MILASALTLFAVLLYVWVASTLYRHHDDDLAEDAWRVVDMLAASSAPVDTLATMEQSRMALPLLMVRNNRGEMIFRSARLAATEPDIGQHSVLTHAALQGATSAQFFTVRLGTGLTRFICVPLANPAGAYVQVGRSLGDVDLLLRVIIVGSAVLVPLVLVLTAFGAFASAKRALQPMTRSQHRSNPFRPPISPAVSMRTPRTRRSGDSPRRSISCSTGSIPLLPH